VGRIRDAYAALRGEKAAQEYPETSGAQFLVPLGMSGRAVTYQAAFDLAEHTDELVAAARDIWRTNLAEPPLVVFVDDTPDYDHPLSQVISRPNAHLSQTMVWRLVSDYISGPDKGGAYLLAVKSFGGQVAEIWTKPGSEVRPIRDRMSFIRGYEWKDGTRWVPVDENVIVVHLYFPDSDDIWAHKSPLMDVVKSIRTNDNASKWLDYMLQNGGAPSAVIAIEGSQEAAGQIQAKINDEYMGAENVGKVGVVTGSKISSVNLTSNLSDVDLGPLKDRLELAVTRSYGIPAELLQLYITAAKGEGLQGSSYREKRKILYANKLTPVHHMIEEAVGMALCPLYSLPVNALRFDYSDIDVFDDTPLEKAQRAQTTIAAVASITTVGERRAIASSLGIALDDEMKMPPGGDDIPELAMRARLTALTSYGSTADDKAQAAHEAKGTSPRELKLATFDTKARSLEATFARKAKRVFADERAAAKKALDALGDSPTQAAVVKAATSGIDERAWQAEFVDAIRDVMLDAAEDAFMNVGKSAPALHETKDVLPSFDITHPDALEAILNRVSKLAGSVTQTTKDTIRGFVSRGIDSGQTLREVADSIVDEVGPIGTQTAATRAATIARTETIGALNEGDNLGAAQANEVSPLTKEWLSAGDGDVRDSHMIDGEVIGFNDTFSNGLAYPGDPSGGPEEVINCRCVCLYDVDPEG
jgi:phage portal protein BeeE